MDNPNIQNNKISLRRQRQHELLLALIKREEDLDLMDAEAPSFAGSIKDEIDPARWIDRNRRILEKYQSLVRSAITLDALLDSGDGVND